VIANLRPLLLALGLASAVGASARPSPLPALGPFTARHGDAVVRVLDDGQHVSTGFVIATVGYAAAVLPGALPGRAYTVELAGGDRRSAVVVRARDDLAVLALTGAREGEVFASLPLAERPLAQASGWLVALCHEEDHLTPAAGGLREVRGDGRWALDLPCHRGAPVLDARGRVLAVTLYARGRTASVGVSAKKLRALAQGLPPVPADAAAALASVTSG
jgi:hypothetical protein